MKISRRNFLGKAVKSLALVVVAPMVALPKPSPPQPGRPPGNNVKNKAVKVQGHKFDCKDFTQQIEILEYTPGMTIPYESLDKKRSCAECLHAAKCTQSGSQFADSLQAWNKKVQARLYEESILKKLI